MGNGKVAICKLLHKSGNMVCGVHTVRPETLERST